MDTLKMKVLFSSYYNYLDQTNGASISTRSTLLSLARIGYDVRVFCGAVTENAVFSEEAVLTLVKQLNAAFVVERRRAVLNGTALEFKTVRFNDSGIQATLFIASDAFDKSIPRGYISPRSSELFFRLLDDELKSFKPGVFMTYGGWPQLITAAKHAKRIGAAPVFFLHNLNYNKAELFKEFSAVVVPSEFAQRAYKQKLGLDAVVVPPAIEESKVIVPDQMKDQQYATFINPTAPKGRYFFTGVARDVNKIKPAIPFLIVNARNNAESLWSSAVGRSLINIHSLPNVGDPRQFYARSKLVLFPSLCEESFGRIAVESGMNGVPCLCSDRGALPEVVGEQNVLPIPKRFTSDSRVIPNESETAPWVRKIVELWDKDDLRKEYGANLQKRCEKYASSNAIRLTVELFARLTAR